MKSLHLGDVGSSLPGPEEEAGLWEVVGVVQQAGRESSGGGGAPRPVLPPSGSWASLQTFPVSGEEEKGLCLGGRVRKGSWWKAESGLWSGLGTLVCGGRAVILYMKGGSRPKNFAVCDRLLTFFKGFLQRIEFS